jgi:hypothetical protein
MGLLSFPDWQLHSFQFEPFSKLHLDKQAELLDAMGASFPQIQNLCGLPRAAA